MKGMLSKFDRDIVPLRDNGISEVEQYRSALRNLQSQTVVDAQLNFVPNRVLGTTPFDYHHLNATFLDPSAPLMLGYVWVTASSSTLTRPASLQAWEMFARTVEWHHTPLNFVPVPCLPNTTDTSRPMGWSRRGGWFSQARRQLTKERSCGLQQQQQNPNRQNRIKMQYFIDVVSSGSAEADSGCGG